MSEYNPHHDFRFRHRLRSTLHSLLRKNVLARVLCAAPLLAGLGCSTVGALPGPLSNLPRPLPAPSIPQPPPETLSLQDEPAWPADSRPRSGSPGVVTVAYEEPLAGTSPPPAELETEYCGTPCCPPADCEVGCGCLTCSAPPTRNCVTNPQEYIADGGDQQPAVIVREDWSTAGVAPTDTVIYYETLDGKVCVKPTNRVCIYAPRFGAVRQVTGAVLAAGAVGTQRFVAPVKPGGFDDTDLANTMTQPLAPHGEQQVSLIDAFQENIHGTPLAQILPPQRMSEARVPFENIDVIGTGRITDEEIAVLGRVLQNARTWFTPESIDILVDGQQAALLGSIKQVQDVYLYEMPDKCAMRICKTASHTIASPGDVINFTIRFDNSGVKPLGNAVILDSLSPRLEYIRESQQCSVDARFSAEPNEVGSQVLRWEIESPIEPNEGGVISFDCRVR